MCHINYANQENGKSFQLVDIMQRSTTTVAYQLLSQLAMQF